MILIKEVEVKDTEGNVILDAIAVRHGYTGFTKDENGEQTETPQTKQEFLQNYLLDHVISEASQHISATAAASASNAALSGIDSIKDELKK